MGITSSDAVATSDSATELPLCVLVFGLAELVHTKQFVRLALEADLKVILAATYDPLGEGHPNYRFVKYQPIRSPRGRRFRIVRAIETIANVARVRNMYRRITPDVVNVQFLDERAYYCARANAFPLVLSTYGTDVNRFFTRGRNILGRQAMAAFALRSADFVTADCEIVMERVQRLAESPVRTQRFFFGIDFDIYSADYSAAASRLRRRLGVPDCAKVILSCRRLAPGMGQEYVLGAFAALVRENQTRRLALVFKRSEGKSAVEDNLRQTAEDLKIQNRVFWIDPAPVEEVPVHYALADVVVSYPEMDAVPVSFFETAAARKPLVSSDLPNYQGLFGDAFLFVPPNDSDCLAKTIGRTLNERRETRSQRLERAFDLAKDLGDRRQNGILIRRLFQQVAGTRVRSLQSLGGEERSPSAARG